MGCCTEYSSYYPEIDEATSINDLIIALENKSKECSTEIKLINNFLTNNNNESNPKYSQVR